MNDQCNQNVANFGRASFLQQSCGRNDDILAGVGQDERRQTQALGATLLLAALVRVFTTTAALVVFAVDWRVAFGFGATIGALFYFIDRVFTHAMDATQAERALRRIGASEFKRLSSGMQIFVARMLRLVFAVITSVVLAGAIALYLHDADMRTVIADWQRSVDTEARARAEEQIEERRRELLAALTVRQEAFTVATSLATRPVDVILEAEDNRREVLQSEIERLDRLIEAERQAAGRAQYAANEADLAAECELNPNRQDCEGIASGRPGRGDIYNEAIARAEVARQEERRAIEAMRRYESQREDLVSQLANAEAPEVIRSAPTPSPEVREAREALRNAEEALLAFDEDRDELIAAAMEADPQYFQHDPTSLILRVKALLSSITSPIESTIVIGTVLFGLVIDLAPYIAAAAQAPGAYALRQAAQTERVARELRNAHARAKCEDADLLKQRDVILQDESRRQQTLWARWNSRRHENAVRREDLRAEFLRKRRANDAFDNMVRFDRDPPQTLN